MNRREFLGGAVALASTAVVPVPPARRITYVAITMPYDSQVPAPAPGLIALALFVASYREALRRAVEQAEALAVAATTTTETLEQELAVHG